MENINRSVFSGVMGMLMLVIILLLILAALTTWGLKSQQEVMQRPYSLKNIQNVKMLNSKEQDYKSIKEAK